VLSSAVYEIETPENVRFRLERAGISSRAFAWAIDVAMMACLLQLSSMLLAPLQWLSESAASAVLLVAAFLVQWWYSALCEWWFAGRTCGKWLTGIAVRTQTGLRITFVQSLVRNLLRIVDLLPGAYGVGALCCGLDPLGRRLGDLAAGTVVVRERRLSAPAPRLLGQLQLDLDLHPELLEIAQRLNPYERDAVQTLAVQRDRMPLAVRIESFERLSSHLGERFGFERPPHLSPEKVVLYVFAGLARRRPQES